MPKIFLSIYFFLIFTVIKGQILSGPMLGHTDYRTAKIWVEVKPGTTVDCWVWKKGAMAKAFLAKTKKDQIFGFETFEFYATGLDQNSNYEYQLMVNNKSRKKPTIADGNFSTRKLWAYRSPIPDVSFLTGSCHFTNDTAFDRIYTDMIRLNKIAPAYGGDHTIFETMGNTPADMMLWLGDNWYTRESDYYSEWGLFYRPSHDRQIPQLKKFLNAMPHYAIWDDHDYGPNDADKSYFLAETSRKVFKKYWSNPSYGDGTKGIYTKVTLADADFFMLDDRTWRSNDGMKDSINGEPNMEKRMFGNQQIDWLKNALLQSQANFKIIVTGSQMLNPVSPFDCFQSFPAEYQEFMAFLTIEKINGVLFLTGDRHHTEIIQLKRDGAYPLYDVTVSPLSSGTHVFGASEKNNPFRIFGIDQKQNFAKATITGPLNDRKLTFNFLGIKGEDLGSWDISAKELRDR